MYSGDSAFTTAAPASDAVKVLLIYVVELENVDDLCDPFLYVWRVVILDHACIHGYEVIFCLDSNGINVQLPA